DLDRRVGGGYAAAPGAAVDLHDALQGRALTDRGRGQVLHIGEVIDADDGACAQKRYSGKPVDLREIGHLVRNEDILDAAARENLGLGDLLAADAARATQFLLQLRDIDGLVHLAMD